MTKTRSSLRVWHLISNRWNSAITEYAISSARSLQILGLDNLVTPLANSPGEQRLRSYGIPVNAVSQFTLPALLNLRHIAKQFQPDVVVTYGGPETLLAPLAASGRQTRFFRFRGQPPGHDGLVSTMVQNISHQGYEKILVPSLAVASRLSARSQEKSILIPLGVDEKKFFMTTDDHQGRRPELVIFGRLDPVKGHATFMEIFRKAVDNWGGSCPRPLLKIVGREENTKIHELEQVRRILEISPDDIVYVPERVENVSSLMSAATLGIVPSLGSEFICRVAHEFLLCGTPILVSGAGGLDEVHLENSVHSYHGLNPAEASALLAVVVKSAFAENRDHRQGRSQQAQEVFSLAAMAAQFSRLLGL